MGRSKDYKAGYGAGYAAGKKDKNYERTAALIARHDKLMVDALKLALSECENWSIGEKKIRDCEGYAALAKIFVDNIIQKNPYG